MAEYSYSSGLEKGTMLPEVMAAQLNNMDYLDLINKHLIVSEKEASLPSEEEQKENEKESAQEQGGAVEVEDEFDVYWDGSNDPHNPMNFPGIIKWPQTVIVAIFTFITPLASSMFAPAIPEVMQELHFASLSVASFAVSIYILGYAIGPLLIAPASEHWGRLPTYHTTNVLYIIFTVACALSTDIGMLLAFRLLAGAVGSCPLVLGAGTIADLIPAEKRATVMALWSLGPLLGPVVGPIAGAFLASAMGWRWVFWVIAMAAGVATIGGLIVMKETYGPVILEKKARRLRKETGDLRYKSRLQPDGSAKDIFLAALIRPMKMLIFSPITLILSFYMAVVYGYLYLLFTTITSVFEGAYGFAPKLTGLSYLGIGIGLFIGIAIFGRTSSQMFKKHGKDHKPEHRLVTMVFGGLCIPVGLFLYGWSAQYQIQWIVPEIGTAFVGIGLILTFMPIGTYLVDAFTRYAASATAANTILRSLLGALLPLAGGPMYEALGLGWGNSTLAFIALALAVVPVALLRYGETIRTRWPVKL